MKQWTRFLSLTVAVVFAAGTAWAQTTTTPPDKSTPGGSTGTMDKSPTDKSTSGMDKGAKADKGMKGGMSGGKERVKQAQQALKDKGHDPGAVDGVMGPKTQAALKDFQKKEGIKESGRLDQDTMSKLGVMKTSEASPSTPAASPSTAPSSDKSSSNAPSAPSGSSSTDLPKKDNATGGEQKKQ